MLKKPKRILVQRPTETQNKFRNGSIQYSLVIQQDHIKKEKRERDQRCLMFVKIVWPKTASFKVLAELDWLQQPSALSFGFGKLFWGAALM